MIDKTSPPYGEHCRQFVWHVHVLRMFTEREQDELVNKVANQYPDGANR